MYLMVLDALLNRLNVTVAVITTGLPLAQVIMIDIVYSISLGLSTTPKLPLLMDLVPCFIKSFSKSLMKVYLFLAHLALDHLSLVLKVLPIRLRSEIISLLRLNRLRLVMLIVIYIVFQSWIFILGLRSYFLCYCLVLIIVVGSSQVTTFKVEYFLVYGFLSFIRIVLPEMDLVIDHSLISFRLFQLCYLVWRSESYIICYKLWGCVILGFNGHWISRHLVHSFIVKWQRNHACCCT